MPATAARTLVELRRARGLSRQALAERVGCSVGMITALEGGAWPRRSKVLARVLAEFQVDERAVRRYQ